MYSMKEVCEMTGLGYESLKFYCNEGLIPDVKRDKNNYHVFSDNDIRWIKSLGCLKKCGMTIAKMKAYVRLCIEGESTIPERTRLLDERGEMIMEKIKELEKAVVYIDWKKSFYASVLSGEIDYNRPIEIPEKVL